MIEEGLKNQLALNSVDKIDKYLENKYIIQPELELRRKKEEEEKIRLEEANRLKLIAEEKEIHIVYELGKNISGFEVSDDVVAF